MTQIGYFGILKVFFGLAEAPEHFQQLINEVLKGIPYALGYLDDILIFSVSVEKHLKHLRNVFDRLKMKDLKIKRKNTISSNMNHITDIRKDICPLSEILKSTENFPMPKTPKGKTMLDITG